MHVQMPVDAREKIEEALKHAIRKELPGVTDPAPTLERPRNPDHGDFATPEALNLAKKARQNPRKLAEALAASSAAMLGGIVTAVETAGPGFINFRLSPAARQAIVPRVLDLRDRFGRSDTHHGERVIVEFVSANPTGPLHVGHGRQAALGDAIATLLEWQGYAVSREFYYNDAGAQIQNLALSVRARAQELLGEHAHFPEDGYHGEYIRELAQRYLDEAGTDLSDIESIRQIGACFVEITLRELADVFAVIAVLREMRVLAEKLLCPRTHGERKILDLRARIVVIELARNRVALPFEQRRDG